MKKCPFCAEEILDDAVVCKHCHRDLPKPPPAKKPVKLWQVLLILIGGIFIISAIVSSSNSNSSQASQPKVAVPTTDPAKQQELAKELADQQAAFAKTPAGKLCAKHPDWANNDCEQIVKNQIWIGMTLDQLKYERGLPNNANVSNYGSGEQYQWCWTDETPSCFYSGTDEVITSYN